MFIVSLHRHLKKERNNYEHAANTPHYEHTSVTSTMVTKWKTSTAGVERCPLDTRITKKKRQSRVRIQFLAARALFRTKQTKKEPACSVAEQAGVLINRVIGGLRERVLVAQAWSILFLRLQYLFIF